MDDALNMMAVNNRRNAAKHPLSIEKKEFAKIAKENLENAQNPAAQLAGLEIVIRIKAGEGGRLFGAIASKEIAAAVKEQAGLEIDKKKIVLADPIKTLGSHDVKIKLHKDVTAELKVNVVEG